MRDSDTRYVERTLRVAPGTKEHFEAIEKRRHERGSDAYGDPSVCIGCRWSQYYRGQTGRRIWCSLLGRHTYDYDRCGRYRDELMWGKPRMSKRPYPLLPYDKVDDSCKGDPPRVIDWNAFAISALVSFAVSSLLLRLLS